MGRDYYIQGECMVKVRGGAHIPDFVGDVSRELGLASEGIRVAPQFSHQDLPAADFGGHSAPEVLWMGGDCRVSMTLVHFDKDLLEFCVMEAMGGVSGGVFAPCGRPMGANRDLYASGNHYITLFLTSTGSSGLPYRFPACYLAERPLEIPLGTERSLVRLEWRAVPYAKLVGVPTSTISTPGASTPAAIVGEVYSSGVVLWDHTSG